MLDLEEIRSALNQLFEERDQLFPVRDPINSRAVHQMSTFYANALYDSLSDKWAPDEECVQSAKQIIDYPVFICGYQKSGTTLLLNLLDNHPELVVMPGDSSMVKAINDRVRFPTVSEQKEWKLSWLSRFVNPTGQKPFWLLGNDDKFYWMFLQYFDYWLDVLPDSDCKLFLTAVLSYFCANPNRPQNARLWVEKTPRNEMKVNQILTLFPSARFVHIVREPGANLASMKKLAQVRGWHWNVVKTAAGMYQSLKTGLENQDRFGDTRYKLLLYRDLVRNPEATMKNIADFLNITFNDALLHPTVNGLPAMANSMDKDRLVYGRINTAMESNWRHKLNMFERVVADAFLYRLFKHFELLAIEAEGSHR